MHSNIRTLLLQSVCVIYLFAFVGFYIQIPGLLGSNGILPAADTLASNAESSIAEKFANNPSLVWFHSIFRLSVDHFLEYLALFGVLLAAIGYIIPSCCHSITFLLLWLNYKSLCDSGPVFYSQIFDHLLLEAGFLCIFLAPLCKANDRSKQTHPADNVIFWLLRWLLIRFVISVSISRLNEADAANDWWNMNALRSYLLSVPVPIDLTWLAFQTPIWVHKFVSILIDVTSCVGPVIYLIPIRSMRITALSIQVLLQVFAMCVLNYGFYNPLVIVLHLALLNRDTNKQNGSNLCWSIIGSLVSVLLYMLAVVFLFDLSLVNGVFVVKRAITQLQMKNYTNMYMLFVIGMASLSFIIVTVKAVLDAMRYKPPQSGPKKSKKKTSVLSSKPIVILSTILYVFVALFIFYGSVVSIHTIVVPHAVAKPSPTDLEMFNKLSKLHIIHTYEEPIKLGKNAGSIGRPEIVLEVSHSSELGPWYELDLTYKPGKLNSTSSIIVPFVPRLSYQFWNAARSDLKKNPWLISLVYRLLQGKTSMNEFIVGSTYKRPNFIKASLYTYQFSMNKLNSNNMWKRSRKSDYFSVFGSTQDALLQRMLKDANIAYPFADKKTDKKSHENEMLVAILSFLRKYSMLVTAPLLVWSLFIVTFFFKMLLQ